jgi:hypothetical protein
MEKKGGEQGNHISGYLWSLSKVTQDFVTIFRKHYSPKEKKKKDGYNFY